MPKEVTRWALREADVEKWLAMIEVRTLEGNSDGFEVKVGLHQGSMLSPLLFIIVVVPASDSTLKQLTTCAVTNTCTLYFVMDVVSREVRVDCRMSFCTPMI